MDVRALEEPQPLEICVIDDINALAGWEYWLKLSYFTTDLHVVRAWSLNSKSTEVSFESQARASGSLSPSHLNRLSLCYLELLFTRLSVLPFASHHIRLNSIAGVLFQALHGPVVYSFLDADRMQDPQALDEALKGRRFTCNWEQQIFPAGALEAPSSYSASPTGTFRVLLCKLATGSTLAHQESAGDFATREIPGAYASLALIESSPASNETKMLRMMYRVKKGSQVLPSVVLEFSFVSLLIEVSQPMCEVCELLPATLFCPADRAHLCDECDELHHSGSRLLSRHKRLPVTHSPFQFGQCPNHPSEMIDCVCMVCFVALCPHCILIGHHSAADFSEHPLISTLDAYKMSMQGTSPSEEALTMRREKILGDLQGNHRLLSRLHANFSSVHRRIDDSNKALLTQLQGLKHRQVGFLQAVKRELLTEFLLIEWMEAFFSHLRLALCPSDYLTYQHRHDLLAAELFGGTVRVEVGLDVLPPWVAEKLFIEGQFKVTTAPIAIPELRMDEVAEDSLLRVFLTGLDKTKTNKLRITNTSSTEPSRVASGAGQDSEEEDSDEDSDDVGVAEWAVLRGGADEAAPNARVHALSRVLLFPDEPATKGLPSQKQQEALQQEGSNCMRAEPNKEALPPQIRRVIEEAEKEESEGRLPGSGIDHPHNTIPKELVKQLWTVGSDLNFQPLLIILKAADPRRLPELLRDVCAIACYMRDVEGFLRKLIEFELEWVSRLPESLFLSTSSLCGPLFDSLGLHARVFLKQEDRQWLCSLLGPPLGALSRALTEHSEAPEAQLEAPEELVYEPLKSLVDRLTNSDFASVPPTIRALLYMLADCLDSDESRAFKGGLARVPGGPPNPTNRVSASAVCLCAQVVLSRLLASSLQLMRQEALAAATRTAAGGKKPQQLGLSVPPAEANKTAAEVSEARVQQLFWDRRSLPPISRLDKALRRLGAFCSDSAVSALLLAEGTHRKIKEEEETEKVLNDIKEALETHADHRLYAQLAVRVTRWLRGQLELPRLHSPLVLCSKQQPSLGEAAARSLLTYICQLDAELRDGVYKPRGGLTKEEITSPHFERLVSLALKASAYTLPNTDPR
ncbi:hypothetical protein Emed_005034 [Eimeria media]